MKLDTLNGTAMIVTLELSNGVVQAVKEILVSSTTDKAAIERVETAYDRLVRRGMSAPDLDQCGGSGAIELNMAIAKAIMLQELMDMREEERQRG